MGGVAEAGAGGGVAGGGAPTGMADGKAPMTADAASHRFEEVYGRSPTIAVRAPGRVNLIGEHIDYHGLPVLPFAIDRAVHVLAAPAPEEHASRVRIVTTAPDLPPDAFDLREPVRPFGAGDWRDYPRAAASWLTSSVGEASSGPATGHARGIDALVTSDLPMASGLSSSSALVVAAALALAEANQIETDAIRLADQLAAAEQFTGTRGGGMDQAACLLSRAGHVCRIAFNPLRVSHVAFPDRLDVLVADSGEPAPKSGAMQEAYNARRIGGESALRRVAERFDPRGTSYTELLREHPPADLVAVADDVLGAPLAAWFRHTVGEAARVEAAIGALDRSDDAGLGRLLAESHASLRDDLGVSTPALDRLVDRACGAGALGARLTGAGFGGCIIALVETGRTQEVRAALESVAVAVHDVSPSHGAAVRTLA